MRCVVKGKEVLHTHLRLLSCLRIPQAVTLPAHTSAQHPSPAPLTPPSQSNHLPAPTFNAHLPRLLPLLPRPSQSRCLPRPSAESVLTPNSRPFLPHPRSHTFCHTHVFPSPRSSVSWPRQWAALNCSRRCSRCDVCSVVFVTKRCCAGCVLCLCLDHRRVHVTHGPALLSR